MTPHRSSSTTKTTTAILEAVLDFVRIGGLQKGSQPGFAHAFKLSYNTIQEQRLTIDDDTSLTYRYALSEDVPRYTVGLLSGLMDELTTSACFRVGQPSPPGVSLQMRTEWLVDPQELVVQELLTDEMDIISKVTKLGRTISYTGSEYKCPTTGKLLAHSTHVKYMPTGNWIMDQILNNPFLYNLFKTLMGNTSKIPKVYPERPLFDEVLQESLEYLDSGRAIFHGTRAHTNPHGTMHGGCHAMVMEQVGLVYAKEKLVPNNDKNDMEVVLVSQHIDFLRAATGSVDVICETMATNSVANNNKVSSSSSLEQQDPTLHVHVTIQKHGKILSDGSLRFVACSKQPPRSKL